MHVEAGPPARDQYLTNGRWASPRFWDAPRANDHRVKAVEKYLTAPPASTSRASRPKISLLADGSMRPTNHGTAARSTANQRSIPASPFGRRAARRHNRASDWPVLTKFFGCRVALAKPFFRLRPPDCARQLFRTTGRKPNASIWFGNPGGQARGTERLRQIPAVDQNHRQIRRAAPPRILLGHRSYSMNRNNAQLNGCQ